MSSKRTKILIASSIIGLVLLTIGGVFTWKLVKPPSSSSEKTNEPNQPAEKCFKCGKSCGSSQTKKDGKVYCSQKCVDNGNGGDNGNNKEKDLVHKIKNDLQVRLERIKNGSHELEDMMPYIIDGNPKRKIMCNVDGLEFIKWGESISFDDIGEENAQSIINLVKQIRTAKEEWKEKKWQEAQAKADANPDLFYFPAVGNFTGELGRDEIDHFQFYSRQDKKDYRLTIPVLHPDIANIKNKIKSDDWNLYRITGVENIPLVPCPIETVKVPYKIVKLSDHFTIEKIDF